MIMNVKGTRRIPVEELSKLNKQKKAFDTMPTVEAFLLFWLNQIIDVRSRCSTQYNFNSYITSHICPIIGDYLISELDSTIIQYYVNKKLEEGRLDGKGGLSPRTVKEHLSLLRCAMRKAIEMKLIPYNPCLDVVVKKEVEKPYVILTVEEQEELADEIDTAWAPDSNVTVLIGEYAGLRIGEVAGLKMKDIDLDHGIIHVNRSFNRQAIFNQNGVTFPLKYTSTKNGKCRNVPMSDDLKDALTNYIKTMPEIYRNDPECPLFLNKQGKAMEPRLINYHFAKLLKKKKIKGIHFHSLRHTFATRALEANMNIKTCSEILGHSSIHITEKTYTHLTITHMLKEIKKMKSHHTPEKCK